MATSRSAPQQLGQELLDLMRYISLFKRHRANDAVSEKIKRFKLLLESKADVEVRDSYSHGYGFTPILLAAELGLSECVRLLIDAKANVNVVNPTFPTTTPLLEAIASKNADTVQILFEAKAQYGHAHTDYPSLIDIRLSQAILSTTNRCRKILVGKTPELPELAPYTEEYFKHVEGMTVLCHGLTNRKSHKKASMLDFFKSKKNEDMSIIGARPLFDENVIRLISGSVKKK